MRRAVLLRSALVAAGLLAALDASAQDVPDSLFAAQDALNVSGAVDPLDVLDRPELQSIGVRLGDYTLTARTDVAALVNTNVRVRPRGDAAAAAYVAPQLQLKSNGDLNPMTAYVVGSLTGYPGPSTETVGMLAGGVDATRELGNAVTVRAQAEGGRYFEDRALSFTPNLTYRPVKFERFGSTLSASLTVARLIVTPAIEIDRIAYQDGLDAIDPSRPLVQRTRSLNRAEPSLVVGYAASRDTAFYVGASANTRRYDRNPLLNSRGFAIYGGARFRPTALTRLDVALGYQRQDYAPRYADPKGLYARVTGLYSPDRQTAIEMEYRRDISETGGVQVGGLTRDRVSGSVRRELLRNVRLTGSAEMRRYRFAAIRRLDRRTILAGDVRYIAGRQWELFVRGEHLITRTRGVVTNVLDFDRTVVTSGVTLKL